MIDIKNINFLEMLPNSLKNDSDMFAFATAVNEQLVKTIQAAEKANIYYYIDNQEDKILDALSEDLKIDWYNTACDTDTKRQIVKNAVKVHKYKGTPYAVKTAINSVWAGSTIEEWQEYGGKPYYFRLNLATSKNDITAESLKQVKREINCYKNVRSTLDYMQATAISNGSIKTASAVTVDMSITIKAEEVQKNEI